MERNPIRDIENVHRLTATSRDKKQKAGKDKTKTVPLFSNTVYKIRRLFTPTVLLSTLLRRIVSTFFVQKSMVSDDNPYNRLSIWNDSMSMSK
jgi:hypothetical protein